MALLRKCLIEVRSQGLATDARRFSTAAGPYTVFLPFDDVYGLASSGERGRLAAPLAASPAALAPPHSVHYTKTNGR